MQQQLPWVRERGIVLVRGHGALEGERIVRVEGGGGGEDADAAGAVSSRRRVVAKGCACAVARTSSSCGRAEP